MKLRILIDNTREEEIVIIAHKKNGLVDEIERLVAENNFELLGYKDNEAIKLSPVEVNCFISENNKVFALTDEKLQVKLRLYQLEDILDDNFIKINQSCIANIRKIEKTQADFSGALYVVFRNGYRDYISRRNLKNVKKRLGVKL